MKNEIKKKWIEALLGEDYKQGTSFLKRIKPNGETQHCCLGVLCEVLEIPSERDTIPDHTGTKILKLEHFSYGPNITTMIPAKESSFGNLDNKTIAKLIFLNDSGKSFKDIATWIQENVPTEEN